jgi:hypothetical protein
MQNKCKNTTKAGKSTKKKKKPKPSMIAMAMKGKK